MKRSLGSLLVKGALGVYSLSLGLTMVGVAGLLLHPFPAIAQTQAVNGISDEQIVQFAKIVLEMEPFRLEAQKKSESSSDLDVKDEIRREFIRKATQIITSNDMSVPDYNRITLRIRETDGEALKQKIEAEIINLQKSGFQPPTPQPSPS
jgi:hypothetical protein